MTRPTKRTHYTERLCNEYQGRGLTYRVPAPNEPPRVQGRSVAGGLRTATGEFIAIFDADFFPPGDFLQRSIHFFTDPEVGVVQTRWTTSTKSSAFLTQIEAMLLDGHFVLEHGARCGSGLFFNFNGTAGVLAPRA